MYVCICYMCCNIYMWYMCELCVYFTIYMIDTIYHHVYYEMITRIILVSIHLHIQSQIFFLVMRVFKIYSLRNFQRDHAVLLTMVTMLNITPPGFIYRMCVCMLVAQSVQLFVTPWTVACQAPQSMECSRQEYWSELPFPFPEGLPYPEIELVSPTLQTDYLLLSHQGSTIFCIAGCLYFLNPY